MAKFLTDLKLRDTDDMTWMKKLYILTAPLKYQTDIKLDPEKFDDGLVVVPAGFVTDLASIPFPLNLIMRPEGPWKRAAVVHDFLGKRMSDKKIVDMVFLEALKVDGVSLPVRTIMYHYVRWFHLLNH
jgi:hypothetical protein